MNLGKQEASEGNCRMSAPEKIFGISKDVLLPVDARTRYDVYFSDRRVAIVCMGRAVREWDQETLSIMPSAFGVPAPTAPQSKKQNQPTIDEETAGMSLDALLKLSKKSCFYTLEEIERVELVWGHKPKFIVMSRDCESKFAPDERQVEELMEILPQVKGLKDKLWIAGKYTMLFEESQPCPSCGAQSEPDASYCQNCGKQLGEKPAEMPASELTCSQCGIKNQPQALFCKQCGAPVRSANL